jgi:hypothetical protein
MAMSSPTCGSSTETTWPVSSPNRFDERPGYKARNRMPSPSPKGISTPVMELTSRARPPSRPITRAAARDPPIDPATTFAPSSSASAAPANDSSLMPCTAKARSRDITKTPMRPPTMPSTAPAMRLFCTRRRSAP